MFKNKRLLIGLGSTIAAITPVIVVVSCGSSKTTVREHQMSAAEIAAYNKELKEWQDDFYQYDWSEDAIQGKWVVANSFAGIDLTNVVGRNTKKHFYLPTFIDSIDSHAFENATLSPTFELPDQLQTIGEAAFKGVDLSRLDKKDFIPDRTWNLKDNAFSGTKLPEGFKVKKSIITLGTSVFSSADLPHDFTFNPDVTLISQGLFSSATIRSKIVLPETVTEIGPNAFNDVIFETYGVNKEDGLVLPKGLTSIGSQAFAGATFNFRFNVPETVTFMGGAVFNLTKFNNGLDMFGGLEGNIIPENTFASAEFKDVNDSPTINFGDNLTLIAEKAFTSATLPSDFELPSKTESISKNVFAGGKVVISKPDLLIKVQNTLTSIGANAFQETHLPEGFILPEEKNDPQTKLPLWTSTNLGAVFNNSILPEGYNWDHPGADGPKPGAKIVVA